MKKAILFSLALVLGFSWLSCGDDDGDPVAPAITLFKIDAPFTAVGAIDEAAKVITVDVPFGADVSGLTVSVITDPSGASVTPNTAAPVNFSGGAVNFTVTADGVSTTYSVSTIQGPNPLRLVLVGDPANFNDLDPEIKDAYQWAIDEYGNRASYIPFSQLNATAIETAELIWFHYTTFPRPDIGNGEPIFPASALGAAKDVITNFYKAGGNLLLTGISGSYVAEVGRVAPEFGPTNLDIGGEVFITNPDNWGISFLPNVFNPDDYPAGNDSHYLFAGLTRSDVTFEGVTYDAIFLSDGGAKKNRAHIWDFNKYYGDDLPGGCDGPNQKKNKFEEDTNSKVRASFEWDPAACGIELGAIVEFEPASGFNGSAIVIGLGAYEWHLEDGRPGAWRANVEGITANAIEHFIE